MKSPSFGAIFGEVGLDGLAQEKQRSLAPVQVENLSERPAMPGVGVEQSKRGFVGGLVALPFDGGNPVNKSWSQLGSPFGHLCARKSVPRIL